MKLTFTLFGQISLAQRIHVGVLKDPNYRIQSTFLMKLMKSAETSSEVNFGESGDFKLKQFSDVASLQNCLDANECQATLDYAGLV